jgi:hypothetical protein
MFLPRCVLTLVLLAAGEWVAHAQTKPAEPPRASAVKLPDGTIVFVSKKPDEPNPIVDGVVLSAAEYQVLVEQADAFKVQRDAKPVPASKVELTGRIEARGERTVAAVTAAFTFRTTQPKSQVALGGGRAVAVGAKAASGKLPVLTASADGFVVLVETPGEHTVTLELEVPVTSRGTKGELGFEFGLPRAAISTFALAKPPAGVKKLNVGSRTGEPAAVTKFTTATADSLAAKPLPLGPTDTLEVLWEPPGTVTPTDLTAESDVTVRADDAQIETVAKLKLLGTAAEWFLTLPPSADVRVERVGDVSTIVSTTAVVVKPTDPAKPVWVIRTPVELSGGHWLVTVTVRMPRSNATDATARTPYPIGPFFVAGAKQTGRLRVFAPPTVRVGFRTPPDLRRQDVPANAEEDLAAVFAYTAGTKPVAWADLDVRPVPNTVRVRPQHKLRQTAAAWRLETLFRVVPPPRGEVDQLTLEFPPGWSGIEFTPVDLVESESIPKDGTTGRTVVVRFTTPQKTAFEFTTTANFPHPPSARELTLSLPRFVQADERETKVTVAATDGWTVSGTGYGWEASQPAAVGEPLKATGRPSATAGVSAEFDRGLSKLDLRWQPHRAELGCEMRADVTANERQLAVTQVFKFRPAEGDVRPVRLRAVGDLVGFRSTPRLDPVATDEWELKPPADAGKEFTLTVQYAVRSASAKDAAEPHSVPLLWPLSARTDATVRVWGCGRRVSGFAGNWRELPPDISPDHDSLPAFTLAATGDEPLSLRLADADSTTVVVERTLIQAVMADDGGVAVRGRFVLKRWPNGGVELDLPAGADVLIDGKKSADTARVIVPDLRAGRPLPVLDVRYTTPASGNGWFGRVVTPPTIRGVVYRTPPRWSVACVRSIPLVPTAGFRGEGQWGWRGYGFGPIAGETPAELDQWLRDGAEPISVESPLPSPSGEVFATRQPALAPLRLILVPGLAWVVGSSFAAVAVVVGLTRLRSNLLGSALVALAVVAAVLTLTLPQPGAQFVTAAQPGLAVAAAFFVGRAAFRRYRATDRRPSSFRSTLPFPVEHPSTAPPAPRGSSAPAASGSDPLRVVGS